MPDLNDVGFVVFDIDGTLRTQADPRCAAAAPALDALDAAGIPWTFATGRPRGSMAWATRPLFEGNGRRRGPTANYNGCLVHLPDDPGASRLSTLAPATVARIMAVATDMRMAALAFSCSLSAGVLAEAVRVGGHGPRGVRVDDFLAEVPDLHDSALGHDADVTSVVIQCGTVPTPDRVAAMQGALGRDVTVSSSGYASYEVTPRGITKGAALPALAAAMGFGIHQAMAVGDGLNDVEMLRGAGVGVAVGNAPHSVRASADLVTSGHAGSGVAEAVSVLLARKGRSRSAWRGDGRRAGVAE